MKAAIYDPYLDTLGGGERYTATVAEFLESKGYDVDFWWPEDLKQKLNERFGLNLKTSQFVNHNLLEMNFLSRWKLTANYDLLFWVSDGSLPISFAKKTLIHMQIPAHWKGCDTLWNKIKARWYTFISNSLFTKRIVDNVYSINSKVVYPPVAVEIFKPLPKKNLIVSIGRLADQLHAKRQDILIEAFSKMSNRLKDWKLVLAGGSSDRGYVSKLKDMTSNLPIEIMANPSLEMIKTLLGEAKIFWSATGYGVNPEIYPEKMEHFGITAVEAMSAGTVPLVTKLGGHLESVEENESGLFWLTIPELIEKTESLAKSKTLLEKISQKAQSRSLAFSKIQFYNKLSGLL